MPTRARLLGDLGFSEVSAQQDLKPITSFEPNLAEVGEYDPKSTCSKSKFNFFSFSFIINFNCYLGDITDTVMPVTDAQT